MTAPFVGPIVGTLTAVQVAQLIKEAGFPAADQATMVAIAKAESGFRVDIVSKPNRNGTRDRGLLQINDVHKYDFLRLVRDARYNVQCGKAIYDRQGLQAWSTYNAGKHLPFMDEARQAVAGAGNVVGTPAIGGSDPANQTVVYGPLGPQIVKAGVGTPLEANRPTPSGAIGDLTILGKDLTADLGLTVIGEPKYTAGMDTIPHIDVTAIDHRGYIRKGLFDAGNRLTWRDLILRVDQIAFQPGEHGAGEAAMTAQDDIVFALRNLRGPANASGISASTWIYRELSTAKIPPDLYLLAESVPTQSLIARDVPDPQGGGATGGEQPSAWTTIVRLAEELGKWVFISGRRLVFGSAKFAMQWCAPTPVYLGWDGAPPEEQFITMPSAKRVSVAEREMVLEVRGRVPHGRAHLFRPGCAVNCYGLLGIANPRTDPVRMMVMDVEHVLANDTDGADIVLIEPVDPPAKPPGQSDKNALNPAGAPGVSGGAADGQVESFVRNCLSQTGKIYIFGAEASKTDPNPRSFDCSELIEWAAARAGIQGVPDGSSAQINACDNVTVEQAINTRGALLWHPGHIAVSLGNGRTIEASSSDRPIGQLNARGRFQRGGLIRGAKGYPGRP